MPVVSHYYGTNEGIGVAASFATENTEFIEKKTETDLIRLQMKRKLQGDMPWSFCCLIYFSSLFNTFQYFATTKFLLDALHGEGRSVPFLWLDDKHLSITPFDSHLTIFGSLFQKG